MTKLFIFITSFFMLANVSFGQQAKTETPKVATASDTTENYFSAGFYLTRIIPILALRQSYYLYSKIAQTTHE